MLAGLLLAASLVSPRDIGPSPAFNSNPLIASDGDGFVVLWSSQGTHFARLRASGEILSTGDIDGSLAIAAAEGPAGSAIAALWDGNSTRILSITREDQLRISEPVVRIFGGMAWNGSVLLITDTSGDAVMTDERGDIIRRGIHIPVNGETAIALARREEGFIAAWVTQEVLYAAIVNQSGDVSVPVAIGSAGFSNPSIACDGATTCLLLFQVREQLRGVMVGATLSAPFTIASDAGVFPTTPAWDGKRFVVAYASNIVQVVAIDLDGSVAPLAVVSSPNRNSRSPSVAVAQTAVMLVRSDVAFCFGGGSEIVASSLAQGRDVLLTPGLSSQAQPAIAEGASTFLIAWREQSDVAGIRARLIPAGEAVTLSPGPASLLPAVGSDGRGYLVAWQESDPQNSCKKTIVATRFGSGINATLGAPAHWETRPMVTWNGSQYVVIWERTDPTQIVAMRVDASGRPLDAMPVALTAPEEGAPYTSIRHVPGGLLWTGNGYLLLWNRQKSSDIPFHSDPPPEFDLRARTIARDLTPIGDSRVIATNVYGVAAAINTSSLVALWKMGDAVHASRMTVDGALISDSVIENSNDRITSMTATPSGFAALLGNHILNLGADGSLLGGSTLPATDGMITSTAATYSLDGAVYFWTAEPVSRRRPAR